MKKLKILLGDPRHHTVGAHSNYIPINIGYIATFLKQEIKNVDLEIELEVDPDTILSKLDNWKPDIVAMSNYCWNASLSSMICDYAKKLNQNTLCVLGGPEFPAGTGNRKIENTEKEKTYDKCLNYLIERPSVDYFAYSDGEVAFLEIVSKFIENKFSLKLFRDRDMPIRGCVSVSKDKKKLLVGDYILRIGMKGSIKADGRDIVPSPYLTGILDKFMDGSFQPSFETSRGCPFLCTYCDQGIDESKICAFSTQRCADEMLYVAKKISKYEKGVKSIGIFDSNWGLYQKDLDLAEHIAKVMEKYDWPQHIYCSTPKSKRENLLKIDDKLKNRVSISLPMQSMDSNTLNTIKRKNLPEQEQIDHIRAIQKRGKTASAELIIPLPGETEETYFAGLKFLMDNGVVAQIYTLMQLCGAELGRDESIKKYDLKSRYRILPKQFGNYHGKRVLEVEQVCVESNTMSFESYLRCRNNSFFVKLLSQHIFFPIQKLTQKFSVSWFDVNREVAKLVEKDSFKGKFKEIYDGFCNESHTELFNTKEEVVAFYSKPENYESLLKGDVGENLLEKYVAKGILVFDEVISAIFCVIRNILSKTHNKEKDLILDSTEKWLKNLYMIEEIFNEDEALEKYNNYELKIDFDFPSWLSQSHLPFDKFLNKCTYKMDYDIEKIKYSHNERKSLDKNYSKARAIARFSRKHMQSGATAFQKQFQKVI